MSSTSQQLTGASASSPRAPTDPGVETTTPSGGGWRLDGWRLYGLFILGGLAIAALSLLLPATPSFDPWCWLVWGREILHGGLHTAGGSSWKPLPVIFTTIFALFGKAQPNLWLLIARAGFVVCILMAGRLSLRAMLWLAPGPAGGRWSTRGTAERVATLAPAALAALIAMFSVALSGGWLANVTLGYSEGLAVAFSLIALERHIDGHHRQAFACGLVAALDRPEIWIVWGPYGLWLMWRDRGARVLVVSLALLTLVLWFVPQQWGGGSLTSGLTRATHVRGNSNALKSFPLWSELQSAWKFEVFRVKVSAVLMILCGSALLGYHFRTRNRPTARVRLSPRQQRGLVLAVGLGLFGFAWWLAIAIETQAGLSGNNRYLYLGNTAIDMAGGMFYGSVAIALAHLPRLWISEDRERLPLVQRLILASALLSAIFVAFPNFIGSNYIDLGKFHKAMRYQAGLRRDFADLISAGGGAAAFHACGSGQIMTEMFQVPMVAWYLNERIGVIAQQPAELRSTGPWPNIILQDSDVGNAPQQPSANQISQWTKAGAHYSVSARPEVRLYKDCASQPNDPKASIAS